MSDEHQTQSFASEPESAPATNILRSTNNDAIMDGRKKLRVDVSSAGTAASSVATTSEEIEKPRRLHRRRGGGTAKV